MSDLENQKRYELSEEQIKEIKISCCCNNKRIADLTKQINEIKNNINNNKESASNSRKTEKQLTAFFIIMSLCMLLYSLKVY